MKKEYLFRALNDVGDDLIHMAEHKRFPNQWRRWLSLAACLALVLSLSVLALPYFPMGCGASGDKSMAPTAEAPAEAPEKEAAMDEAAAEEEAPAEEAAPEAAPETEEAPAATEGGGDTPDEGVYIWVEVDGVEYEVLHGEPVLEFADGVLGEVYTTVSDTNLEEFLDAEVWAAPGTQWFDEDPMDEGMATPKTIVVYDGSNWYFAEMVE